MTTTDTAAAPALTACPHCGFMDSGGYCSSCGGALAPQEPKSMGRLLWEHAVAERAHGAAGYLRTTWWVFARPTSFFRAAMQRSAHRAGHEFPSLPASATLVPPRSVYDPVKYLFFSFVLAFLAEKVSGRDAGFQVIPNMPEELNAELMPLLMLGYIGAYSLAFHYTSGRRVSTGESAVFSAYSAGAFLFTMMLILVTPESFSLVLIGELLLMLFLVALPYIVFPRLYPITRGRLLLAQIGAGIGAYVLVVIAAILLMVVIAVLAAALGFPIG
jgi:hypothetical protein